MRTVWIFLFLFSHSWATPGAVTAPELWLKAENAGANGTAVAQWNDLSGNARHALQTVSSKQPIVEENSANFNPVIHFTKNNKNFLDVPNDIALNGKNLSIFIVTKFDGSSDYASPWTTRNDTVTVHDTFGHVLYVKNNKYEYWNGDGNPGWRTSRTNTAVTSNYEIATVVSKRASNSSIQKFFYFQGKKKLGTNNIGFSENTTRPFRVGAGATEGSSGRYFWNGDIAEIIVYAKRVSLVERQKVESYLALKYGITLIQNKVYYDSQNTKYWTAANNSGYKNDIAGLGRDDVSPLFQSVSKSINNDAIITMASSSDFVRKNDANRPTLGDDRSFLVWSNNDGAGTWSSSNAPSNGKILNRVWKVQKTGTQNAVSIQIDTDDAEFNLDDFTGKLYFVKGSDLSTAIPQPMTQNGNLWSIDNVSFSDADLFSFVSDLPLPDIKLEKTSTTIYDPVNEEVNPKAIPGALVKYEIHLRNEGLGKTDDNSTKVSDTIPSNMRLCVSTVLPYCKEATLVQGAVSSTLSLGSISYYSNGTVHTAAPDAQGYDDAVTQIEFNLNGSFAVSDGINHPSATIEFYMGVK